MTVAGGVGCGSTTPSAATSAAPNPATVVAPCNRLADEDLTISGLAGISVPAHITRDCGMQSAQGIKHCRIDKRTELKGYAQSPWVFWEGIGFDVGLNHYDLIFQGTWYDHPPFSIDVPGKGVYGTYVDQHGGKADVILSGGLKAGLRATMGWTAGTGNVTFNPEDQNPISASALVGGGTVDMEMKPGPGAGPVHISGTWHAEQPCTSS